MLVTFAALITLAFLALTCACVRRLERAAAVDASFDIYDGPGVADAEYAAFLRSIDRIALQRGRKCPCCGLEQAALTCLPRLTPETDLAVAQTEVPQAA